MSEQTQTTQTETPPTQPNNNPVVVTPPVVAPTPEVIATPTPPVKKVVAKPKAISYASEYADSLKDKLGTNYPKEFDEMTADDRIKAMKAALLVLTPKTPALEKNNTDGTPLNSQATKDTAPKSFHEMSKTADYANKLRRRGSFAGVARKRFERK